MGAVLVNPEREPVKAITLKVLFREHRGDTPQAQGEVSVDHYLNTLPIDVYAIEPVEDNGELVIEDVDELH